MSPLLIRIIAKHGNARKFLERDFTVDCDDGEIQQSVVVLLVSAKRHDSQNQPDCRATEGFVGVTHTFPYWPSRARSGIVCPKTDVEQSMDPISDGRIRRLWLRTVDVVAIH